MDNFYLSIMTVYNYSRFIEGHKFIRFVIIVRCLPSLNKGVTLPGVCTDQMFKLSHCFKLKIPYIPIAA